MTHDSCKVVKTKSERSHIVGNKRCHDVIQIFHCTNRLAAPAKVKHELKSKSATIMI